MGKKGKMKAKLEEEEVEERSQTKEESVIVLSSDEEANEDLSLKIVEKAKKRKKGEGDLDEFKASDGYKSAGVINLSSDSSDEVEVVRDPSGSGAIVAYEAALAEVKKKKSKKKKKKKLGVQIVEEGNKVDVLNPVVRVEAVKPVTTEVASAVDTEELIYRVHAKEVDEPVQTEVAAAIEKEEPVHKVHAKKVAELVETEVAGAVETEDLADAVETNAVEKSDNIVLRKLLRGPRYFDPPNSSFSTCYNCGEEGHMAVNCTSKKRKKPCFVCGSFEHGVRNCTQGKDCYICNKAGHRAKNCPEKNQQSSMNLDICLRCGESGHNMFSCTSDYAPEDLKDIQCYICKKHGHLCCVDPTDAGTGEVSCYNCGQSGHSGSGCAKQRGETSGAGTPTLCYKCGEEGHFARGCIKNAKRNRRVSGLSTPIQKSKKKARKSSGFQSVPPDLGKVYKKKSTEYAGRDFATTGKSKQRGGWIPDDPGDLSNRTFRPNVWASPTTPTNNYHRNPNFNSGGHFPHSGSPWTWSNPNHVHGTPSSHGSANYYHQHRFSASRFGNSSGGGWDGRTYGW